MGGRRPFGPCAPERWEPKQAERHRDDADEAADDGVAEEAPRARLGRLYGSRDLVRRLDACRARDSDCDRLVLDPGIGDDDGGRAQAPERGWAVDGVGDDRVVHGHRGDGQILALRVRHPDSDLARRELDPAYVEGVGRRRVFPDQLEQGAAARGEERDDGDEQDDGDERPQAPAQRFVAPRALLGGRVGFHQCPSR